MSAEALWRLLPGQQDDITPRPGVCPNCRNAPSSRDGITMRATATWPVTERACDRCTDELARANEWGF